MHMKKIATLNLNILRVEESFGYLKLVSAETPLLNPGGDRLEIEMLPPRWKHLLINMVILPNFLRRKKAVCCITCFRISKPCRRKTVRRSRETSVPAGRSRLSFDGGTGKRPCPDKRRCSLCHLYRPCECADRPPENSNQDPQDCQCQEKRQQRPPGDWIVRLIHAGKRKKGGECVKKHSPPSLF